jgi:hypothetical protein
MKKRIIAVQADARARAGLVAPLAVGVVRWRGVDERLALVLKLTLRFDEGTISVVEPEPVRGAVGDGDDLEAPSDFVLFKPMCDLLLVGHAHCTPPAERVDVELEVGSFKRAFRAVAGSPSASIPLRPAHLRDARDEPLAVGPRNVVRESSDAASTSHDHAALQSAPASFQVELVAPDAPVALRGLSPRSERCAFSLPGLAPWAWAEGVDGLVSLPIRCDTMVIDSDYQRIQLVWRAPLPEGFVEVDRFVISLEREAEPRDLDAIFGDLPRGTIDWATEEHADLAGDDADLQMASYEVLEHRAEPELTLPEFAAVSARLAEQDRPRAEILADLELTERAWTIEERAWIERMGDAATAGDGTVAAKFADLFLDAQDQLAGPNEPRSLESYVAVKVELERADKPKDRLDERGICFGEWMRLERYWNDCAAEEPEIARRLAELIAAARQA